MIIIGIALSIIAIVCGTILISYGIIDMDDDNIFYGILLILLNIFLLFIHFHNLNII